MNGNGFTGTVVGGGPGTGPYQVTLNNSITVSAFVPYIDGSEVVPVGFTVIVIQLGTRYYFQPPVFAPAN